MSLVARPVPAAVPVAARMAAAMAPTAMAASGETTIVHDSRRGVVTTLAVVGDAVSVRIAVAVAIAVRGNAVSATLGAKAARRRMAVWRRVAEWRGTTKWRGVAVADCDASDDMRAAMVIWPCCRCRGQRDQTNNCRDR